MHRDTIATALAVFLLALVVLPAAPALADKPLPPLDPKPYVAGNNAFTCDLYGLLREKPGNVFFSPYSIRQAVGIARLGAHGGTAAEMDAAMHFASVERGRGHAAVRTALEPKYLNEWVDGKQVKRASHTLLIANALWGQEGFPIELSFRNQFQMYYQARFHRVDFKKSKEARARINAWVEERTRDKIKDLIPVGMPTPDTRLVIANAIYFKAAWQEHFNERATEDGDFTGRDGVVTPSRFMRRTGSFRYADLEDVQLLEIPYRGDDMGMLIVLPKAKDGLAALEAKLDAKTLAGWLGHKDSEPVKLRFPRFEFTAPIDLTAFLQKLGMKAAFSASDADFSGITKEEKLFIGAVLHKAFVAVDEKGTEAAAATVIAMRGGRAPQPEKPAVFDANHPFLFLIRHRPTNTVLFMGRVESPTAR